MNRKRKVNKKKEAIIEMWYFELLKKVTCRSIPDLTFSPGVKPFQKIFLVAEKSPPLFPQSA